jgi:non-specific serine/threonine protein kinase/serine/threonine-protein kinase
MSDEFLPTLDTPATADAREVEGRCERFEAAWNAGPRPQIEAFLRDAPEPLLPALLLGLLRLDTAYRRRAGETPAPADYLPRFPQQAGLIEAFFQPFDATRCEPESHRPPETPYSGEASSDQGTGSAPPFFAASDESPGARLGPYTLLQKLGRGGMGTVWMAEQHQPVRRRVALKLIKPGMDTAQVLRRFEAERQALALMDHPNIAKVLDAGATATGRPYFVMELVQGIPVTKYCDQEQLTPRQRLELFIPVCQAVQHAHQKGIIHRDLKPSNVLVTRHDGRPVPIVIDFGLAKATTPQGTGQTVFTELGQVMGTPSYMAPEQADLDNPDIDTRADVYSLGVLLYELLTGTTPFATQQQRGASVMELLRLVREVEPPRPSTKLSGSERLPDVAARRKVEPRRLIGLIRGDLDWIVMKCLEKERGRRYQTANALAMDLQRYLADEPVLAGPPGRGYRLRKFLKRNRGPVAAAALVLVALIAGVVGTTWGLLEAQKQRDAAEKAEALAREEAAAAEKAEALAREEAAIARAVNDFLHKDLLGQADVANQAPGEGGRSPNVTVRELLDRTAKRIEGKFQDQPLVEAAIRLTVGNAYVALPRYADALPHLERSLQLRTDLLGEDHPDTLTTKHDLAELFRLQKKLDRAEVLHREALEGRTRALGPDDPSTLQSKNDLAVVYWYQRNYDQAETLLQEVYEARTRTLGPDHLDTLESKVNLAQMYELRGKYDLAEKLSKEAVAGYTARRGPDHPDTLTARNNLAQLYRNQRKFDLAEPLYKENIDTQTAALGPNHPDTLRSRQNLAGLYKNLGKYDLAEPLYQQALAGRIAQLGENNSDTLNSKNSLAELYRIQKKYDLAEPLYRQALDGWSAQRGANDILALIAKNNLAQLYLDQGQYDRAEPLLKEAVEAARRKPGLAERNTQTFFGTLVDCYEKMGQPARAEPLLRELAEFWKQQAADSWQYADQLARIGSNLLLQQKPTEAEPLLLQGYEGLKKRQAQLPPHAAARLTETLERLVQLYDAAGKKDEADAWRKRLDEARAAAKPPAQP